MSNPFSISNNGPVKLNQIQQDSLAGILAVPSTQGPVTSLSSMYNPTVLKPTKAPVGLTGKQNAPVSMPSATTLNPINPKLFDPVKHTLNLIKNATASSVANKQFNIPQNTGGNNFQKTQTIGLQNDMQQAPVGSMSPMPIVSPDTTMYFDDSVIPTSTNDTTQQNIMNTTTPPVNTSPMVDTYSKDWLSDAQTNTPDDYEKLYKQGANLNQIRNDIYSGVVDPYKLGVKSGIPFTAGQLDSVENAMGKSIDPVINDIKARIAAKEKTDQNNVNFGVNDFTTKNNLGFNSDEAKVAMASNLPPGQRSGFLAGYAIAPDKENFLYSHALSKMGTSEQAQIAAEQRMADGYGLATDYANKLKNEIPSGYWGGKLQDMQKYLEKSNNPDYITFNSLIQSAQAPARVKITGVSLSDREAKLIDSYMPNMNDTVENALNKMKIQKAVINATITRNVLRNAGVQLPELTLSDIGIGSDSSSQSNIPEYKVNADGSISVFKKVGGGTNKASIKTVEDAMNRISNVESGGNYKALGPVVQSGDYKGQQAIGKYQVMYGNIGPWSKEVLGYEVTPQQFYSSPQLQDAIVAGKMAQIYSKYKNWDDVASVWFTGQPLSKGYNKSDVLGTTGRQYVDKFNA